MRTKQPLGPGEFGKRRVSNAHRNVRPCRRRGWRDALRLGPALGLASAAALLAGCSEVLPTSGPSAYAVRHSDTVENGIQVVPLTLALANTLRAHHQTATFAERFHGRGGRTDIVGPGDVLEVTITEAPPASLFSSDSSDTGKLSTTVHATTFPEQMIGSSGTINIPFAGQVQAAGKSPSQIEDDIISRLKAKANQPQVLVRLVSNNTEYATVLGAVTAGTRLTLTPHKERVLDALAKAGGSFDDVNKVSVQFTRGGGSATMSMGEIIRDPAQNIILEPGDLITVTNRAYAFTVMGATFRTDEIKFEAPSITLAQALVRAGGLADDRANVHGIFLFRYETPTALDGKSRPARLLVAGKVPVVYSVDLSKPSGLFVAKTFTVENNDILYVANAPAAELRKFLEIIGSIVSPITSATAARAETAVQ